MSDNKRTIIIDGKIRALTYEEALVEFLDIKGEWMSTSQISKEMGIPYTTINHRLKMLADDNWIVSKDDRSPRIGRPRILWGSVKLVRI